jgi:hypothetical protein
MAATVTTVFAGSLLGAAQRISVETVTGDSSYATGGYAITPNQFGFVRISAVVPVGANTGYVPSWDATNSKLKVFYADNNAASDSALIEVAAATDLSAVSFTVIAFGI